MKESSLFISQLATISTPGSCFGVIMMQRKLKLLYFIGEIILLVWLKEKTLNLSKSITCNDAVS